MRQALPPPAPNLSLTGPLFFSTLQISITVQKRECNIATCATSRLADKLNKFSRMLEEDFEPTDVGPDSYGRRRRDIQS